MRRNYEEEVFPELALEHLERYAPCGSVEVDELLEWLFGSDHAFRQPSPPVLFGQPPITLFQAPRFYIEALFWFSGTTAIHEHGFSGSFAVLAGSSVHSHWHFDPKRTINSRMLEGCLERVSTEILRPGAIRLIYPGNQLIHQLFHLEVPSITIVARTYLNRNNLPQYQYLPPGLAIDPEDRDPLRMRRLMLLEAMSRNQIGDLRKYCRCLISNGDVETLYYTFSLLARYKIDDVVLSELYALAEKLHGEVIDLFRRVCAWERRTRIITSLRSKVSDPEARFLLALLMLMPGRDAILEVMQLQFPSLEPRVAVESCLEKLSGKETLGFEFNDVNRVLLRGIMDGFDPEALLTKLKEAFQDDSIAENRARLVEHMRQLARSELLFPLLSESPLREGIRAGVSEGARLMRPEDVNPGVSALQGDM